MQRGWRRFAVRLSMVVGVGLCPAIAQGAIDIDHLRLELEPYAWVPLQSTGSLTLRAPSARAGGALQTSTSITAETETTIPVDLTPLDLLGTLLPAGHLRASLGYGPVSLVYDGTYLQLGTETNIGDLGTERNAQLLVQHGMVAFRAFRWAPSGTPAQEVELELSTGVRSAWRRVGGLRIGDDALREELALEGVFGVATPVRLSDDWSLTTHGLLTVPGPSWEILGGAAWTPGELFAVGLGYRVNSYRSGEEVILDLLAHGPYLSVRFHFGDDL